MKIALFKEGEENREHQAREGGDVIPVNRLPLKTNITITVNTVSDTAS